MIARFMRVLMLSTAVLTGGQFMAAGGGQANAAAQTSPVRLTAQQMLDRQGVALTVITRSYTALPKDARGRSAPFLKGLIDLANAYRDVGNASKARDSRKMGAALPKVATSLAKLNSAYQLSGIRDPNIAASLKSLNSLWKSYLKVVDVRVSQKSAKQIEVSSRKINQMRSELMRRSTDQRSDRRVAAQRAHILALLKEADAASRQADQLWYAAMLMAEVYGYYAGTYEYYSTYEPIYLTEYRDSWQIISTETRYFYTESVSYYEEYSWSSYEETIEVSESYDFGLTEQELTAVETEVETSGIAVSQEAESLYQASDERQTLDSVETEITTEEAATQDTPAQDGADTENAQKEEGDSAPPQSDLTDKPDESGQQADAPPESDDACAASNSSSDCATTPDDETNNTEENTPEKQSTDETTPNEGVSNEQPQEEGDVCAGDNPPADCFSDTENATGDEGATGNDAGVSGDESATGDDGSADSESAVSEEPAQDDAAVQENSADDSSGGDEGSDAVDDTGGGEEE